MFISELLFLNDRKLIVLIQSLCMTNIFNFVSRFPVNIRIEYDWSILCRRKLQYGTNSHRLLRSIYHGRSSVGWELSLLISISTHIAYQRLQISRDWYWSTACSRLLFSILPNMNIYIFIHIYIYTKVGNFNRRNRKFKPICTKNPSTHDVIYIGFSNIGIFFIDHRLSIITMYSKSYGILYIDCISYCHW